MADPRRYKRKIALTGGAGFIGSNLLRYLLPKYPDYLFINIDCLTYAGSEDNLKDISNSKNYIFEKINITDFKSLETCFDKYKIDSIIHLAAESHVDRSIIGPKEFINTNIVGTCNLLELARSINDFKRFLHISTDEVYGSLTADGRFTETSRYNPTTPYAASKAASDHLVNAYHKTYGVDAIITNCSNNFGPYQYPEKLIPLVIINAIAKKKIPVYGDGTNIRDWISVTDHCRAIDAVFHKGQAGETYNIGADCEISNIDLINKILSILEKLTGNSYRDLIEFVADRPGHDFRYALDSKKLGEELRWQAVDDFEPALESTIKWYLENNEWILKNMGDEFKEYYKLNYDDR